MKLEDPPWAVTRPYCQLLEHLTRSHGLHFLVHILFGIALFKVILLPEKPKTTSPNPKSKQYLKSTDQSLIPKRKGRYRSPSDPFFRNETITVKQKIQIPWKYENNNNRWYQNHYNIDHRFTDVGIDIHVQHTWSGAPKKHAEASLAMQPWQCVRHVGCADALCVRPMRLRNCSSQRKQALLAFSAR